MKFSNAGLVIITVISFIVISAFLFYFFSTNPSYVE